MAITWTKLIPRWSGDTIEPPEAKKDTGYIAGDKPPAKWENWLRKGTYEALDETRDVIEGIDSQLAQDALNLVKHKTENLTQIIVVDRDSALSGDQIVSGLSGKPKRIDILMNNQGLSIKHSIGFWSPNQGSFSIYNFGNNNNFTGVSRIVVMANDANNLTWANVKNVQNGSFTLEWSKLGSGGTGSMQLLILCTYHGED